MISSDAYGGLVTDIVELTSATVHGDVSVDEDTGRVKARFTPAAGCRSFLTIERRADAVFAPMYRVDVSTLVGKRPGGDLDEDIGEFLDDANGGAFGGTWVLYPNGDVGVSGSVMFADPAYPGLPALVAQLLVLQAENAVLTGRPPRTRAFEDLGAPTFPERLETRDPDLDLGAVGSRLHFRSGATDYSRLLHAETGPDWIAFAAPPMVGQTVRLPDGETVALAHGVTIARTEHPRMGPGFMFQVSLDREQSSTWLSYRGWVDPMLTEPWYGNTLGALMIWQEDDEPVLVYRGFVPDVLSGVLDRDQALDFVVDSILGAVNRVGVFESLVTAHESLDDPDQVEESVAGRSAYLRNHYRVAALRSVTRPIERPDGLTDVAGPLVDPGLALLDRLALDQMQIHTAPFIIEERGFLWLPGPYAQRVTATAPLASRHHEIVDVVINTYLGSALEQDLDLTRRVSVKLMADLPLSSILVDGDGNLALDCRITVHEGTWWHRAALIAMAAPLQLACADMVRSALEVEGVSLDARTEARAKFAPSPEGSAYDSIYEVVPWARQANPTGCPPVAELISLLTSRLHESPDSRLFGDLDNNPNVVLRFADLSAEGGWDPDLGEAMVMLAEIDHEVAGESLRVALHPGFPPGGDDLVAEAMRLTALSHQDLGVGIAPSWSLLKNSVAPTVVLPRICIDSSGLDPATEITVQAVQSNTLALARAVLSDSCTFPLFDRNRANLTRSGPPREGLPTPWESSAAVWVPTVEVVALARPLQTGRPERWDVVYLDHNTAHSLADWAGGKDNALAFGDPMSTVSGLRDERGITLTVNGREWPQADNEAAALAAQLYHPEGAGAGWMPGRVVISPVESWVDSDGDPCIVLGPGAAVLRVMAEGDVANEGISALTPTSAWVQFHSQAGAFDVDLEFGFIRWLLEHSRPEGTLWLTVAFPRIDERVTEPPPEAQVFELNARMFVHVLEEIEGRESGRN